MSSANGFPRHPQQQQSLHSPKHQMQMHPTAPPRVFELIEALKHEVEGLYEESKFSKHHRKELELKITGQMNEMTAMQQSIFELERIHTKMKQQYDDEIRRLRQELDERDSGSARKTGLGNDGGPPPSIPVANRNYSMGQQAPGFSGIGISAASRSYSTQPSLLSVRDMTNFLDKDPRQKYEIQGQKGGPQLNMRHRDSIPGGISLNPVKGPLPHPTGLDYRHSPYQQRPPPLHGPGPQMAPRASVSYSSQPQQPADQKGLLLQDLNLEIHPKLKKLNIGVELLHTFDHTSVVCCVEFSPDGKYLATGCNHYSQIFEVQSGRKVLALVDESIAAKQEDLYIRSVCFSPDGVYLATGAEDKIVRIWDIVNGRVKHQLLGHDQDIYSLDWTRDGKYLVSGSGDRSLKIWNAETGVLLRTISNDSDPYSFPVDKSNIRDSGVTSLSVRPADGRCIVTGSLDEVVRLWDLRTGYLLERFEGHEKSVYSVSFSPNGNSIVSGSLDKKTRVWDLSPATTAILASPPSDQKPPVTINKNSRCLFAGHSDYVLTVGYPSSSSSLGKVDSTGTPIPGDIGIDWVFSGGKDRYVMFWDANSDEPQPLISMVGHKNSVIALRISPTGGLFATGSGDQKARLWRVSRKQPPQQAQQQQQNQYQNWDRRQSSSGISQEATSPTNLQPPRSPLTGSPVVAPKALPAVQQPLALPIMKPQSESPKPESNTEEKNSPNRDMDTDKPE